ncbi:MAG: NUDIX domain-containing protein [Clostridia bacterium]|nr:NUDIX domain-containing protein [Clostridia bacterium]
MELWDIYDKDRNLKDGTMVRGEPILDGDYHLVVHVCIFNSKGEMLIQKRQPFKSGFSGMWDVTVGGSAVHGDTSRRAAERELFEEVGIKVDLTEVQPHLSVNWEQGFDDIYLVQKDVDIETLTLQYEEVERVSWATEEQILSMIDSGEFIPYYKHLIQLLFSMRQGYGAHQN